MVAVPEVRVSAPERFLPESGAGTDTARLASPTSRRRVVAVAATAMELLRPESDLLRSIQDFPHVDLLVAGEDLPAAVPGSVGVLSPEFPEFPGCPGTPADADADSEDVLCGEAHCAEPDDLDDLDDDDGDELRAEVARLGLSGLQLHRLGLSGPLVPSVEQDLVAALSELVGFDPEPGVYCLAPAPAPGDPARTVINQAVQRIAQVYGLPLLRYRCLELSVVGGAAADSAG